MVFPSAERSRTYSLTKSLRATSAVSSNSPSEQNPPSFARHVHGTLVPMLEGADAEKFPAANPNAPFYRRKDGIIIAGNCKEGEQGQRFTRAMIAAPKPSYSPLGSCMESTAAVSRSLCV